MVQKNIKQRQNFSPDFIKFKLKQSMLISCPDLHDIPVGITYEGSVIKMHKQVLQSNGFALQFFSLYNEIKNSQKGQKLLLSQLKVMR